MCSLQKDDYYAGIETVIIRDTEDQYRVIKVSDWLEEEDKYLDKIGY